MLVNMHATEATNTQTPSMNRPPACPSEHVRQSEQSVLPPFAQSIVSHSPSWAQAQELSYLSQTQLAAEPVQPLLEEQRSPTEKNSQPREQLPASAPRSAAANSAAAASRPLARPRATIIGVPKAAQAPTLG